MTLVLFTFAKKKNSTARPSSSGTSFEVKLKRSTSLLSPEFLLSGDIEEILLYTYAYWDGRYYFITDITLETDNLVSISCRVRSDMWNSLQERIMPRGLRRGINGKYISTTGCVPDCQ